MSDEDDDSVRRWLVSDVDDIAGLWLRVDAFACGAGTAEERRGWMVESVCCHCCRLCSCLAVSSAIESMNARMSTFLLRDEDDDDEVGRDECSSEAEVEELDEEVGRERVAAEMKGEVLMAVVDGWDGGSDKLSLCSSVWL